MSLCFVAYGMMVWTMLCGLIEVEEYKCYVVGFAGYFDFEWMWVRRQYGESARYACVKEREV